MNSQPTFTDSNLRHEPDLQTITEPNRNSLWAEKLPTLLRLFGASAVLFSLYSFLFRGWEGSDDLMRYLMLLGHTAALVIIALASGSYFHEGKSPRLLMMLSLVSVPVNFAILGAFIFAGVNAVLPTPYPTYVAWSVDSLTTALMLAAIASATLIPVILLAFRTLVRGMSLGMSALFISGNLALLLPIRDPQVVFILTAVLALFTMIISAKTARQRTESKTVEGVIALLLQFLPVAILLGRNIWLYSADLLLFTGIATTLFIMLRHCAQFLPAQSGWRVLLELVSIVLALVAGCSLTGFLLDSFVNTSIALLTGSATTAAMSYAVAERAKKLRGLYRSIAVLSLITGVLLNLLFIGGFIASLTSLILGLALTVYSHSVQQRSLFIGGIILLLAGIADQLSNAFNYFDFSYWLGMALVGVTAIVLASMLEAKGSQMKRLIRKYRAGYAQWSF